MCGNFFFFLTHIEILKNTDVGINYLIFSDIIDDNFAHRQLKNSPNAQKINSK